VAVQIYILINDQDPPMIETTLLWDGETPYDPSPWTVELQTDSTTQVKGATYVGGAWVPPSD